MNTTRDYEKSHKKPRTVEQLSVEDQGLFVATKDARLPKCLTCGVAIESGQYCGPGCFAIRTEFIHEGIRSKRRGFHEPPQSMIKKPPGPKHCLTCGAALSRARRRKRYKSCGGLCAKILRKLNHSRVER